MMQQYIRNKVFVDDQGLLVVLVVGPQEAHSVVEMGDRITQIVLELKAKKQPVLVFDDLRNMGQTSVEARQAVASLAKSLDFDKGAMIGDASVMMKYGTNLMLRAIGKSNIRYFSDPSEAKAWLLSNR